MCTISSSPPCTCYTCHMLVRIRVLGRWSSVPIDPQRVGFSHVLCTAVAWCSGLLQTIDFSIGVPRLSSTFADSNDNRYHPKKPHNNSYNGVGGVLASGSVCRELQAESTIYDTKSDDCSSPPNMRVCGYVRPASSFVKQMVDDASQWLK